MPPKPFYEVNPKTYLFDKNDRPEEKVRQWVLFELLSTYGVNINDIQVEVPVKIGSKKFSADIVVLNNHSPSIVVECKEENKETKDALEQAISYANYLGANFVVATNGHEWMAQRKQYGEWVSIVDISSPAQKLPKHDLNYLLWFTDSLRPLLFWIYRSIPANNAKLFFDLLQRYLYLKHEDFPDIEPNIYKLTESLVKIIAWRDYEKRSLHDKEIQYTKDEILKAYKYAEKVFIKYNIEYEKTEDASLFIHTQYPEQAVFYLSVKLGEIAKKNREIKNNSVNLLRFAASISKYLVSTGQENKYLDVSESIVNDFFNFIDPYLLKNFNVVIPDRLDEYISDFYSNFESEWHNAEKNYQKSN